MHFNDKSPVYVITRNGHTVTVRPHIEPRHDLRNHSPDGFQFGYGGSGPSQLALALLAHATGDDALAIRLYHRLKWDVIAKLDQRVAEHTITKRSILEWIRLETESDDRS
jgi:hypothetical protein